MSPLAKSIYETVAFFDALDLPATLLEIKEYFIRGYEIGYGVPGLGRLQQTIAAELAGKIICVSGFYCLAGRSDLVPQRFERFRLCLVRLKKAQFFLRYLRFVPYVRGAAVSGSLALLNSHQGSDIDLLVVTRKDRMWIGRLLVTLFFELTGQRRHGRKIANRFCLNHYVAQDAAITKDQNLFTAFGYSTMIHVVGREALRNLLEQNTWIRKIVGFNIPQHFSAPPRSPENSFFRADRLSVFQAYIEFVLEISFLGSFLNAIGRIYQRRRIKIQEDVVASDAELSFHFGLHARKVLAKFREKIAKFGT